MILLNGFVQACGYQESAPVCPAEVVSPDTLRVIVSDTKSISVIAAKRRFHLKAQESNFRIAGGALAAGLKSSISMDSLLSTFTDKSTEVKGTSTRHKGSSRSKQDQIRTEGKMGSHERLHCKKRSRSFETNKRVPSFSCIFKK